jgi:hypothetical protein
MKTSQSKISGRQVVVQQVKFARDDIRPVKFVKGSSGKRFAVMCKGFPRIIVRSHDKATSARDQFEAFVQTPTGREEYVTASSPFRAYASAVRHIWLA